MKRLRLLGIVSAVSLFALWGAAVLAQPSQPDSVSIDSSGIRFYRHLVESGDVLGVFPYNISYSATPNETAAELFTFRLIDTDNVTELGSKLPEPYNNSGFGDGVVSFYFGPSEAPTWGESYFIRIDGNPAYFATPSAWSFIVPASAYTTSNTTIGNQEALEDDIVIIADDLSIAWDLELTEQSDLGIVFSSYGEAYFRRAVYGIQAMAPNLFAVVIEEVEDTAGRSWSSALETTFYNRFAGTWVEDWATGFSGFFGMDRSTGAAFPVLILAFGMIGFSAWQQKKVTPGYTDAWLVLIGGALLGNWIQLTILALITFLAMTLMLAVVFLNRS